MKKTPLRMCLGCREMKTKNDLIRVVRAPGGSVELDALGKSNGRGAYVCKDKKCFARVQKSNALSRALKTEIPKDVFDELEKQSG
ncbi:MAG: YlxR family protein [Oscillospiraceae bacterium]|nr:YlxR family protein [Oscillospiraceae bacterium]